MGPWVEVLCKKFDPSFTFTNDECAKVRVNKSYCQHQPYRNIPVRARQMAQRQGDGLNKCLASVERIRFIKRGLSPGISSVWSEYSAWNGEAEGSNPSSQTKF